MIEKIDPVDQELSIHFDDRWCNTNSQSSTNVSLAFAVTIHKEQGTEFLAVLIPVAMQPTCYATAAQLDLNRNHPRQAVARNGRTEKSSGPRGRR